MESLNKISDHSRGPDSPMNMNGGEEGEDKGEMKKGLLCKCFYCIYLEENMFYI